MSGDLVAFLNARLDEDEREAEAAFSNQEDPEHGWGTDGRAVTPHVGVIHEDVQRAHVAKWHPGRVLADCAAKRAVVEVLAKQAAACPPDDWPEDGEIMKAPLADNARHLLRLLVQPYSGHPHFHPSWAVD